MALDARLKVCSICQNRTMNRDIGLICSITNKKPNFEHKCPDFKVDEKESERRLKLELNAAGDVRTSPNSSPKYIINSGVLCVIIGPIIFFLLGTLWGLVLLVAGILLIIKGERQKEIIKENKLFQNKLRNLDKE